MTNPLPPETPQKFYSPYSGLELTEVELLKESALNLAVKKYVISLVTSAPTDLRMLADGIQVHNQELGFQSITPIPSKVLTTIKGATDEFTAVIDLNYVELRGEGDCSSQKVGRVLNLFDAMGMLIFLLKHARGTKDHLHWDPLKVVLCHGFYSRTFKYSEIVDALEQLGIIYAIVFDEQRPYETGFFKVESFPKVKEVIDRIEWQKDFSLAKSVLAIKHGENPNTWASNHPHFRR